MEMQTLNSQESDQQNFNPKVSPNEIRESERIVGLTSAQRQSLDLSASIPGWGADLDPANRPGVPMDKAPMVGAETLYPDIEPQVSEVEILKSTEHKQMPPVFGTTLPPKGLSGALRRFAFRSSEGQLNHWLTLLAADRVDMIEHVFKDIATGHFPNLYKEMGLAAEWKYNRQAFVKKLAIVGAVAGAAAVAVGVIINARD